MRYVDVVQAQSSDVVVGLENSELDELLSMSVSDGKEGEEDIRVPVL